MTNIAQTASITLITAVPGSGKTLRAVWYMQQAIEQGQTVFSCNVNGLAVEGVIDFPDPTKWEDLPPNSVLVVDECQKFFRADRALPAYISAMETIRHMGIRLILLTQHPALIHTNIRALVGYHEHLVRENGKESATIYTRSRVIDNVRSDKALAVEDHHTWAYPKHCYALYKSAEVHTVKRTIPHKYKRAALLFLVAGALLGGVVWQIRKASGESEAPPPVAAGGVSAASNTDGKPSVAKPAITTAAEYAAQMQPMIADRPWTAAAFVNRPMVSDPKIYCMSSGTMKGKIWHADDCACVTEQGTRYELEQSACVDISRYGPSYNPFIPPDLPQQMQQPATQASNGAASSGSPAQASGGSAIQAKYGAMRDKVLPNSKSHIISG